MFLIYIFLAYVIADFLVGLSHWFKDTYMSPFTPFFGKHFIWSSRLHHYRPRYIVECSDKKIFIESGLWTLLWMIFIFNYWINIFTVSLFLFISANDIVHKYAHTIPEETPTMIKILQDCYILQSYGQHALHHNKPYSSDYCSITPFMNPILEYFNFWTHLESLVEKYFGVKPRTNIPSYIYDDRYPGGLKFIENMD